MKNLKLKKLVREINGTPDVLEFGCEYRENQLCIN